MNITLDMVDSQKIEQIIFDSEAASHEDSHLHNRSEQCRREIDALRAEISLVKNSFDSGNVTSEIEGLENKLQRKLYEFESTKNLRRKVASKGSTLHELLIQIRTLLVSHGACPECLKNMKRYKQ